MTDQTDRDTLISEVSDAMPAPGYEQRAEYYFLEADGQHYKCMMVLWPMIIEQVPGLPTAPANFALRTTITAADENGKALKENGNPVLIGDPHTENLSSVRMSDPDFDPVEASRIEAKVIVARHRKLLAGRSKVLSLMADLPIAPPAPWEEAQAPSPPEYVMAAPDPNYVPPPESPETAGTLATE